MRFLLSDRGYGDFGDFGVSFIAAVAGVAQVWKLLRGDTPKRGSIEIRVLLWGGVA